MKILQTIFILLNLTSVYSFLKNNIKSINLRNSKTFIPIEDNFKSLKKTSIQLNIYNNNNIYNNISIKFQNKKNSFIRLIRSNNIIPTIFLCFSGAWIVNPSFKNIIHSKNFIVFTINTICIMSTSMILNDIYDIKLDRINNPSRPLITGEITIKESLIFSIILLGTSEYLTLKYLPLHLQKIIHASIIYITIYTPILKKIPIVKNLSCAFLVASAPFFSGLTMIYNSDKFYKNVKLLLILCTTIFFGSWSNELLLDIRDYKGDKENKLKTIPVWLGIPSTFKFINIIMFSNLMFNRIMLTRLINIQSAIIFSLIMIPQLKHVYNIKKCEYSINSINKTVNYSNYTLFLLLLYFCGLTKYI